MLREFVYGPCGQYCGECPVEDCAGCQPSANDSFIQNCVIRNCAEKKGIIFCNECGSCPCMELHHMISTNNQKMNYTEL